MTAQTIAGDASKARAAYPSATVAFDWVMALLAAVIIGGGDLDGWAHNHDRVDDSFFTPWHAVLYSGLALNAAFLGVTLLKNHARGYEWLRSVPRPYVLSVAGVAVFGVAGLADMVWHTLFGVEVDTEALVSPTHLGLAAGAILILSGPLRSAWSGVPAGAAMDWRRGGAMLLSVGFIVAALAFMTHFAHPLVDPFIDEGAGNFETLPDIYVMNSDGSSQTRVIVDPERWDGFAAWSPDGTRLVVSVGEPRSDGQSDLYVINADGSNRTKLTSTRGNDYAQSWSPDGTKVAFVSNLESSDTDVSNVDVFVINADGTGERRLTDSNALEWGTSWSADGRRIAFSSNRGGRWKIYTMDADGANQVALTSGPGDDGAPAWSRDGRSIAFQRVVDDGSSIYVYDLASNSERRLEGNDWDYQPAWSPDGTRIAFTSFIDGTPDIFVMNSDGTGVRNLTRGSGTFSHLPAWSPDGTKIAYTSQTSVPPGEFQVTRRLGLATFLLQPALLMGPLLVVAQRWRLPFGALTLIIALTSLFTVTLLDEYRFLPGAVAAGLIADVIYQRLATPGAAAWRVYVFALLVPVVYYSLYFATHALTDGIDWSIHLTAGAIALSGVAGLLVSFLLLLPFRRDTES